MKEMQDKIARFEKFESQMEREWQQLQQMKNMLFVDHLTLLLDKTPAQKAGGSMQQDAKTEWLRVSSLYLGSTVLYFIGG